MANSHPNKAEATKTWFLFDLISQFRYMVLCLCIAIVCAGLKGRIDININAIVRSEKRVYCHQAGGIISVTAGGFRSDGIVACRDGTTETYRGVMHDVAKRGETASYAALRKKDALLQLGTILALFAALLFGVYAATKRSDGN
ncbi:MAG: hypothetical protein ACYDA1_04320 [Vulcanimicrobiaceae bacterium]